MAADVAGYSRLMGEDEEYALRALQDHLDRVMIPAIETCEGQIVKTTGDGFIAYFDSALHSVQAAHLMQSQMAERNRGVPANLRIEFRIGINEEAVMLDRSDVFGHGVNIAARLESVAEPGGITVTASVHEHVAKSAPCDFSDAGFLHLKNIAEPVQAFHAQMGDLSRPKKTLKSSQARTPRLAVLPFGCRSSQPDHISLTDGLTEDLIADLSKISGLFIIASSSSSQLRGQEDAQAAGIDLQVDYILSGSVRPRDASIRINSRLIDAATNVVVWAERFDGGSDDLDAVLDSIATQVAGALHVVLHDQERELIAHVATTKKEARELFRHAMYLVGTKPGHKLQNSKGLAEAEEIIRIDPEFAGGYSVKAMGLSMRVMAGISDDPPRDLEVALEFARTAIELDPLVAEGHQAYGLTIALMGRVEEAIEVGRNLIRIDPNSASASFLVTVGLLKRSLPEDLKEAEQALSRSIELDPKNVKNANRNLVGMVRCIQGRYREAIEMWQENADLGGPIHWIPAWWAAAHAKLGNKDKVEEARRLLFRMIPEWTIKTHCHMIQSGLSDSTLERIKQLFREAGLPEG